MQIIILSAGIGNRLNPITLMKPKCLVNVNNKPILKHQIDLFIKNEKIHEIIVVIGYKADSVKNFISSTYNNSEKIKLIENKKYLTTNNMYSLFMTRDHIKDSFILINGDVILEQKLFDEFLISPYNDAIAVDIGEYYEESMKVVQKNGFLVDISKEITKENALGCSIDLYKFSKRGKEIFFSKMEEIIVKKKKLNLWTEIALQELLNEGKLQMKAFDIKGRNWFEIDDFDDLYNAEIKFNNNLELLKKKKVFFFDMDGTIYLENILFDNIHELFVLLKNLKKKFYFLSNNSSISTNDYYKKLKDLGLDINRENIIISTHPTIHYLKDKGFKRLFLLGTESLKSEFIENGFEITDREPQIVVLAFDKELTYEKLEKAAYFLQDGLPYIATHPDKVCPTQRGYIPDVGSMIALLYESTGKKPIIFGKPNKEMLLFKLKELNLDPKDTVLIGDRLYTDIRMGNEANVTTICVLTGETSKEMIEKSEYKPDIILSKVTELIKLLK